MLPGVLPNIFFASWPTATTVFCPLLSRIATTEGSLRTIPTSFVYIRVFAVPSSNDIVPVRNQVLSIDTSNSSITGEVDGIISGGSQAGTTYTTTSSYS